MSIRENTVGVIDAIEPVILPETAPREKSSMDSPDSGHFDAIIIGGGPAGMTAGVYLARKMINTLLISPDLGGQVLWTSNVENYPGYDVISGFDLSMKFQEQLEEQTIQRRIGDRVVTLEHAETGGMVETEQGARFGYKSLIVASGKRSRSLNVPGEKEFGGRGVTYCATCDGPLYRGQKVAVIGGGNSAVTAAHDLLSLGCEVNLVNFMPGLQADSILVEKAQASNSLTTHTNHQVDAILGKTSVTGIRIHDRETGASVDIECIGVFIEIGLIPNTSFVEDVLTLNEHREIIVDCRCQTNRPGIFAAGDVTNVPNKQIIIAAGEGAKAALGVHAYLLQRA